MHFSNRPAFADSLKKNTEFRHHLALYTMYGYAAESKTIQKASETPTGWLAQYANYDSLALAWIWTL